MRAFECEEHKEEEEEEEGKRRGSPSVLFFTPLFRPPRYAQRKKRKHNTREREEKNREFAAAWSIIIKLPRAANAIAHEHHKRKSAPNPLTFKNAGNSSNLSFIVLIGFVRSPSYKQRKFPPSSSPPRAGVGFVDGM